jgi:hypothetical protein
LFYRKTKRLEIVLFICVTHVKPSNMILLFLS